MTKKRLNIQTQSAIPHHLCYPFISHIKLAWHISKLQAYFKEMVQAYLGLGFANS